MNGSDTGNAQKVLIVDDEPYVLRVLKMKLENSGYEVITAVNGKDGLKKFIGSRPSVVITDVRMPLMDGQEMYQMMQEHKDENKPFLVIMMTSTIDRALHLWAEKMENICFVEKPVSPRNVLNLVSQYISKLRNSNAVACPDALVFEEKV
ncbi:MAG: response regulator [Nitrospirae bacterium]|nr:response regulator [Nitrospirota bacterium]